MWVGGGATRFVAPTHPREKEKGRTGVNISPHSYPSPATVFSPPLPSDPASTRHPPSIRDLFSQKSDRQATKQSTLGRGFGISLGMCTHLRIGSLAIVMLSYMIISCTRVPASNPISNSPPPRLSIFGPTTSTQKSAPSIK